ncbi:MAG: hypothetical protein ACOX0D_09240 [Sphaerochaeta sp.]
MKWSHENKKSEASILTNIKAAVFDGEIGITTSMFFKRIVLPFGKIDPICISGLTGEAYRVSTLVWREIY